MDKGFAAVLLPKVKPLPQYKSWGYLLQNEVAQELGRRQFYTEKGTGAPWLVLCV